MNGRRWRDVSVNLESVDALLCLWASHITAPGSVILQALKPGQVSYLLRLLEAVSLWPGISITKANIPSYLK